MAPVVREFVARVKDKALGEEVAGSLSPGQALVGVVHKELTALMGGDLGADSGELSLAVQPPAVILMAGLQGAGKTTTGLARAEGQHTQHGRKTGKKKVLVVSADVYRPAAIEQLKPWPRRSAWTSCRPTPARSPRTSPATRSTTHAAITTTC